MSSTVSKSHAPPSEVTENIIDDNNSEDREVTEMNQNLVTSHIYLKPAHSTGTMEKEVVLRRIRHRKRMNKLRNSVQVLLSSPFAAKPDKVSVHQKRWLDDPFAAP